MSRLCRCCLAATAPRSAARRSVALRGSKALAAAADIPGIFLCGATYLAVDAAVVCGGGAAAKGFTAATLPATGAGLRIISARAPDEPGGLEERLLEMSIDKRRQWLEQ